MNGLRALLEEFMNNYSYAREHEPIKGHPLGNVMKKMVEKVQSISCVSTYDGIIVEGSIGKGTWAKIPWLALMDSRITDTTQKGIYVVYLFSEDMSKLYLTLNQGVTEIAKNLGTVEARRSLRDKAREIGARRDLRALDGFRIGNDINLATVSSLGQLYVEGTIAYKEYHAKELPDDNLLEKDLCSLLSVYKNYVDEVTINDRKPGYTINYRDAIHCIYEYIKARGFFFEEDLLFNFFLSLKTKPFVILAGISGTGKTKLIELFAEAVGATSDNGRFELIPVRPDWNDSSDLLGYRNLEGRFQPGVLTRVIQRALSDINNPYFVCLDEMNLARVEYYFSDFLSLLETRRWDKGKIRTNKIFRETDFVFQEDRKEFAGLYIPENLYIVGTVNMDETTHPFSKKVLDRANTIEFFEVALDNYGSYQERSHFEGQAFVPPEVPSSVLKSEYCVLRECLPERKAIVDEVVNILIKVNDILQPANLHVGYRVRDEISFYMIYNQEYGLMDKDNAFDWQLLQKILPRLQGSSRKIYQALIGLFELCTNVSLESDEGAAEEAEKILENISVVRWPRSARKIAYMLGRYEEDGFTSFWA
ncbi:McrB family protein [Desulfofundulus sp.]|uniref:McrB family protein n=1 Tax=Desulfofundulus sp. TaxID=2282750 RepID=UPI003C75BC9E